MAYQVAAHSVDISRNLLPSAIEPSHISLSSHLAIDTHVLGNSLYFVTEARQTVDHVIDGFFEDLNLSVCLDVDLLAHVAIGDRLSHGRDTSDLWK